MFKTLPHLIAFNLWRRTARYLFGRELHIAVMSPDKPPTVNAYIAQHCTAIRLRRDKRVQFLPPFPQLDIEILHSILCFKSVAKHSVCLAIEHFLQRQEPFLEFCVIHFSLRLWSFHHNDGQNNNLLQENTKKIKKNKMLVFLIYISGQ